MIYTSWKHQLETIVKSHFPEFISSRFTFRSDSEVYIPGEDESIWDAVRGNKESMHVLFDRIQILEMPYNTPHKMGEYFILRAFRDAVADGRISIEKVAELSDNKTARRNKREKQLKKRKQVEESYKFARDNTFDIDRIESKLPAAGKNKNGKNITKLTLKGGE